MNSPIVIIRAILTCLIFTLQLYTAEAQISFLSNNQKINGLAGRGVAIADLNSDGNKDIFIVNGKGPEGEAYKLFFGDGHGRFVDSISMINPVPWASQPLIVDFNNDGKSEVITGWTVWMSDGKGNFWPDTTCFKCMHDVILNQIEPSDVNRDGLTDLFCSVYSDNINEVRIYLNDGHGHFLDSGQRLGLGESIPYPVAPCDINGDGNVDVVISGWRNKSSDPCPNRILINDGKGSFTDPGQSLDEGMSHSHGLIMGDFDKDGDTDLIIGMQQPPYARMYLNNGKGLFTAGQTMGSKSVEKVETGDLDNDGDLDIFFACIGSNEIWLNDGKGNFNDSGLRLGSEWSWNAALGDLNNDNRIDIVAVNFGPEFQDGKFSPRGRLAEVWLNSEFECDYLNETRQGTSPVIFGRGPVSVEGKNTHSCVFSPDGKLFVFSRYPEKKSYIMVYENGHWGDPEEAFFNGKETSFSPYNDRVFYYRDGDIFYNEKAENRWSKDINAGDSINTSETEYFPSVTYDGTLYFSRNGKWNEGRIMFSTMENGKYRTPVDIGLPVNTGGALHACVASDESYMIFNSPRKGSYTKLDLWISFHKEDGSWTNPQNLGKKINSGADAILCPTVTPDGKYMFFTKLNLDTNTGTVYWVSTDIFDALKNSL